MEGVKCCCQEKGVKEATVFQAVICSPFKFRGTAEDSLKQQHCGESLPVAQLFFMLF